MVSIAKCCCGQSSIKIQGRPLINAVCHCADCKKRTGSAFGISVYVKEDQVIEVSRNTQTYTLETETGVIQHRSFCKSCGTTLYWQASSFPGLRGIAGGCFADAGVKEPEYSFSNENACSWLKLPSSWSDKITLDEYI